MPEISAILKGMMTNNNVIRQVKNLVSQGEGQRIEFKQKASFPEKIVKEVVAFANSDGGYLFVGVADDGSLEGLKHAEEEKYVLDKAIIEYCKPKVKFSSRNIPISSNRSILEYKIYKSKNRPHYALPSLKARRGIAFVRYNDKSIQASRELIEILKSEKRSKGQLLSYGNKEKLLLEYLKEHETITLKRYCEIADLSERIASKTLVKLVLAKVLNVVISDDGDYYLYNSEFSE